MVKHIYDDKCKCNNEDRCFVCYGLKYCIICKGAESSLTTECCERKLTEKEDQDISHGRLDFINSSWIKKESN